MNAWVRRAGFAVGGVVGVVALAAGAVYGVTEQRFNRAWPEVGQPVALTSDSAIIARGEHLVRAIADCTGCHYPDFGGGLFVDAGPVGTLYSANLTGGEGSRTATYTDADWERAVRHGLGPDRKPLKYMVATDYEHLSNEDFNAIIAFVKSRPKVDRTHPAQRVGLLGRGIYLAGQFPIMQAELVQHDRTYPASVTPDSTVGYGNYIAKVACYGCHGPALAGGPIPGAPPEWKPAANITPTGLAAYDEAAFVTALREGKRPGGAPIDTLMPWKATRNMTDMELKALWKFLQTVPPKAYAAK
ncbi:MAG: cytochrome c [Gemmatimonadaceae bacterium]|nr:cytochrome c [Gemmatimonadaceae bacterium]